MPHFVTYSHVSRRAAVTHLQWSQAQGAYMTPHGPVPQVPIPFSSQVRTAFLTLLVRHLFTVDFNMVSATFLLKFSLGTLERLSLARPTEKEALQASDSSITVQREEPSLDGVAEEVLPRPSLIWTSLRFSPRATQAIRFWRQSSFPPRPL